MRTTTYGEAQGMRIRKSLRSTISWPARISQMVGCFPLILTRENEYAFQWFGKPMLFIYFNFIAGFFFTFSYMVHKEEIIKEIMGSLTRTESRASSFITITFWIIDKVVTIYLIFIQKPMIKFQYRLNQLFQHLISELNNNPQLPLAATPFPSSKMMLRSALPSPQFSDLIVSSRPITLLTAEARKVNIFGLTLLGFLLVYEVSSGYFHMTRMTSGDVFRNFFLCITCMVGQCSLTVPKLCLFFFIASKIALLKVGFTLLKESLKRIAKISEDDEENSQKIPKEHRKYLADQIVTQLDVHSRLEALVVEFNRSFGIQLLCCLFMSIVLITGCAYLVAININFNFWYVMTVLMPITLLHLFVLFYACHNSSLITIEAQKIFTYLRSIKLDFAREQEFKIWLHYSKAMASPPVICPVNFITINYHTLLSAITIISSYLFVLLQFRNEEGDLLSDAMRELLKQRNATNVVVSS